MKRMVRLVAVPVAVLVLSAAAFAADPKGSGRSPEWSGAYLGAFAGYTWADLDYDEPAWPGFERHPTIHGVTGGVLLGYNHQVNRMVIGIEADGGLGDLSEGADTSDRNAYSAFDIDWTAHVRARAGLAVDASLFYLAAGLALAGVTVNDTDPFWGRDNATHVGWSVGAGIEQALTPNLRLRLEYLYDDFGEQDYTITGFYKYKADVDLTANTVRACIAFHF